MKSVYLIGVAACALGFSFTQQAFAQDKTSSSDYKLETVTVTATKKAESLQNVPISLVALSGATIEKSGFKEFTDLATAVPNLEINQTNGNFALTMRGLGSGPGNLAFEQSVGLFIDGVYSSRARALQVPFLDIERVEVVRGPQGALFGKNTNAGAISMITRKPTDDFEYELTSGYEAEQGGYAFNGFISGPLSDTLDGRISAEKGYSGSTIDNRLTGQHDNAQHYVAVRGQLQWKPTEKFSALLKVEGFKNDYNGAPFEYNSIGDLATCGLCRIELGASGGAGVAQVTPGFWRTARSLHPEYNRTKSGNATLTFNWDVGGWNLTSITAYQGVTSHQANDPTGGGLTFLFAYQDEHSNQFSTEFRGEHQFSNGLDVTGGFTYIRTKLNVEQQVIYSGATAPFPFPNGISDRPLNQDGESFSPYILATYQVTDHLDLTGSLRYSRETKDADIVHKVTGALGPTNLPYNLRGHLTEGLWDYSAKARYAFNPSASVYVSYATGTKAGGFVSNNSTLYYDILHNGASVDYNAEKAQSWEIGGKFLFLNDTANLNIALFDTSFNNLQVSTFVNTTFLTGNAAKAHSRGVEVESNWRLDSHFTIGGNAAYLDAKYDDYPGGACLYNAPPACAPATNNLKGSPLLRAPKWKGSAYIEAQTPIWSAMRLSGRLSLDYTARSYFQPDLNPFNSQPANTKFDARVALSDSDDRWEIAVIGRNLTNKVTWGQAFTTPVVAGNSHIVVVNAPRTIMIQATIRN